MITLRPYQVPRVEKGTEILKLWKLLYLAMEMRTGKTLVSLSIAANCQYKRILFLTTKKALPGVKDDIKLFDGPFEIAAATHGQAKKYLKWNPDLVIVDEAHKFGAFPLPGIIYKYLELICAGKAVILLSGTPTPESYSQMYHQLKLSSWSPFKGYFNFYQWAKEYVDIYTIKVHGQDKNRYDRCNGQKYWPLIKHLFVLCSQEEAGFTQKLNEKILRVKMSDEAVKIYNKLKREGIYIAANGQAAICNGGSQKMLKLWQISSGTLIFDETVEGVIDEDGVVIDVAKASYIRNFFFGKKIVIFYKFTAEGKLLKKFFPNWTDSFMEFNQDPNLTAIMQIQSGSEGTNFKTADALVYYNLDFSSKVFLQSRERMQDFAREKGNDIFYVFSEHGLEELIYKAVSNKTDFTYGYYKQASKGIRHSEQDHQAA